MEKQFRSYLALLDSLCEGLEQLSNLARKKISAVQNDDLLVLDEIMRQEQALALSFRGLEQKRANLLDALGLSELALSELASHFPASMQADARRAAEALQSQYQIYRTSSEVARNTLECNLHEIEKVLSSIGSVPVTGPGYTASAAEPPQSMKNDFRA